MEPSIEVRILAGQPMYGGRYKTERKTDDLSYLLSVYHKGTKTQSDRMDGQYVDLLGVLAVSPVGR